MTQLTHHQATFGSVRTGDIVVDPAWPTMFGRKVIEAKVAPITSKASEEMAERFGRLIHLELDRHAGLTAREGARLEVLR